MVLSLLVGSLLAVSESFLVWFSNGKPYPELRSVGHANHSAMYLLVSLGVAIGAFFSKLRILRLFSVLSIIASVSYLSVSLSLAAFASVFVMIPVIVNFILYNYNAKILLT